MPDNRISVKKGGCNCALSNKILLGGKKTKTNNKKQNKTNKNKTNKNKTNNKKQKQNKTKTNNKKCKCIDIFNWKGGSNTILNYPLNTYNIDTQHAQLSTRMQPMQGGNLFSSFSLIDPKTSANIVLGNPPAVNPLPYIQPRV